MGRRRIFSRELDAVKLVTERGMAAAQATRDRGVHENVLRKWVRESRENPRRHSLATAHKSPRTRR